MSVTVELGLEADRKPLQSLRTVGQVTEGIHCKLKLVTFHLKITGLV